MLFCKYPTKTFCLSQCQKITQQRHTTGASTPCNASCRFCSILQTTRDISVAFSRLAKLLREPRWSGPSSRACHWTPGSCWTNEYPRMCRDLRSPGARSCQHSHENSRATKTSSVHEHDGKAMRKQRTTIFLISIEVSDPSFLHVGDCERVSRIYHSLMFDVELLLVGKNLVMS